MTEGPELDREGLEMLATAVVRQAYEDYLWTVCETMHLSRGEALNRRRVERMELEAFFLSRYYSCLCPVQPETLMQQARREAMKQACRIRTGQLMKEVG